MHVVILAAGRGTRMKDLTESVPKPMLKVKDRTLLEYKLAALPKEITDVIFIIGYQGDSIREYFGERWKGRNITYIEQKTLDGTASALWLAAPFLQDRFLVMMGDDLYAKADMEACVKTPDWSVLVQKTESMAAGGRMVADADGLLTAIEEGDHTGTPGLMNTNMFVLDTRLFVYPMVPKSVGNSEFGLPQSVLAASKASDIPLAIVEATDWLQVTSPEDLQKAETYLESTSVE